jgi:hypothetical protein
VKYQHSVLISRKTAWSKTEGAVLSLHVQEETKQEVQETKQEVQETKQRISALKGKTDTMLALLLGSGHSQ